MQTRLRGVLTDIDDLESPRQIASVHGQQVSECDPSIPGATGGMDVRRWEMVSLGSLTFAPESNTGISESEMSAT